MEPPPSNISAFLLATIHLTIIQLRHRAGHASEEVTPGVVLPSAIAVIGRDSGVGPDWVIRLAEVGIGLGGVSVIPSGVSPSIIAG
jgi:hypothetical protein